MCNNKAIDDQLSSFVSISILKMYMHVFYTSWMYIIGFQISMFVVLFYFAVIFFLDASNVNVHFLAWPYY